MEEGALPSAASRTYKITTITEREIMKVSNTKFEVDEDTFGIVCTCKVSTSVELALDLNMITEGKEYDRYATKVGRQFLDGLKESLKLV